MTELSYCPCKVGDVLFVVSKGSPVTPTRIRVIEIHKYECGVEVIAVNVKTNERFSFYADDFNRTVFTDLRKTESLIDRRNKRRLIY